MRLTKQMREAFVAHVMCDVPNNEEKLREEYIAAVKEEHDKTLPPQVVAMAMDKDARGYVSHGGLWLHGLTIDVPAMRYRGAEFKPSKDVQAKLTSLHQRYQMAVDKRKELATRLSAVAAACTTTQALSKALPEFNKYIPKDAVSDRTVPAIANVVADFVKAGWPKGKQATKEAA